MGEIFDVCHLTSTYRIAGLNRKVVAHAHSQIIRATSSGSRRRLFEEFSTSTSLDVARHVPPSAAAEAFWQEDFVGGLLCNLVPLAESLLRPSSKTGSSWRSTRQLRQPSTSARAIGVLRLAQFIPQRTGDTFVGLRIAKP